MPDPSAGHRTSARVLIQYLNQPTWLLSCVWLLTLGEAVCRAQGDSIKTGLEIPQNLLYLKHSLESYLDDTFQTGWATCSAYSPELTLNINRLSVPLNENGSITTSKYAMSTSSSYTSVPLLGGEADILTWDVQSGTIVTGIAIYNEPGYDYDVPGSSGLPDEYNYTVIKPIKPAAILDSEDGRLYLQVLQRLQQYIVLTAYGANIATNNNFNEGINCQSGFPANMVLPYDYVTAALAYLLPHNRTYNGLPTITHMLVDLANPSATQPMAVTEANVIYEGEQRVAVSNASTLEACGKKCYNSQKCALFVWCPSAKGCTVPGHPRHLLFTPGSNSTALGTQRGSERCQLFASSQFAYGGPGAVAGVAHTCSKLLMQHNMSESGLTAGRVVPGIPTVYDGPFGSM